MKLVLDIVIYVFSLIGGIISIIEIKKILQPYKKISWKKVEKEILVKRDELLMNNYTPSLIVGIGRGGCVIGALLSGLFGNIPILVIDRVYEWIDGECRKEFLLENIKISSNLEKVLLVAGELHSGKTAKMYKDYFIKMGAKEIEILTFITEKFPTEQKAKYSCIETNKPDIQLPWMLTKNYKRQSLLSTKR